MGQGSNEVTEGGVVGFVHECSNVCILLYMLDKRGKTNNIDWRFLFFLCCWALRGTNTLKVIDWK